MIRTVIYGCMGKMGQALSGILEEQDDFQVVAGIDRKDNPMEVTGEVDVIIDFSHPSNLSQLMAFALEKHAALVVATTGYTEEQKKMLRELAKFIPVLHSANMSLGVNLLAKVLRQISGSLSENFDIEIIEKHHNKKVDAPSGTAHYFAEQIKASIENGKTLVHKESVKERDSVESEYSFTYGREGRAAKRGEKEIGIHAVRGGTIVGEHTIIFAGMDEVIELKHSAQSKNIFAIGAIRAARYLYGKPHGFYTMEDIFGEM